MGTCRMRSILRLADTKMGEQIGHIFNYCKKFCLFGNFLPHEHFGKFLKITDWYLYPKLLAIFFYGISVICILT
jgi:hypothetical protein